MGQKRPFLIYYSILMAYGLSGKILSPAIIPQKTSQFEDGHHTDMNMVQATKY